MSGKLYIAAILIFSTFCSIQVLGQSRKVYSYYDESKSVIKEEFTLRSDNSKILQGPYIAYYENGVIRIEGNYVNNLAHGEWRFYFQSGRLKMKGKVINGNNTGPWEYYHEDGNVSMRGTFNKNLRIGRWKTYYPNGFIKTDGIYSDGIKTGLWKYYNEAGGKYAQSSYIEGIGTYEEFFPNGTVKMKGKIQDGERVGSWTFYFEDGNIKSSGEFMDGKQQGIWKFYDQIGNLVSEGPYIGGKMHGEWVEYYENGNIKAQGDILDDQKNGDWKMFFEDGSVKGEGNFLLGTGDYIEYYKSGNVKVKGRVVSGKNNGKWEFFYENGKLEGECIFNRGKGEYVGYYTTGDVKMRGTIEDDTKIGIWELYNMDGTIAGYYKPYYEDGNTTFWIVKDSNNRTVVTTRGRKAGSYKYKAKKGRYFKGKINEYRAFIVGYNPLAPILNSFPLGLEYYMQERLGYEVLVNFLRDPFFRSHSSMDPGETYSSGFSAALRQKFYNKEKKIGTPYFGHEFRYTNLTHGSNVEDINDPLSTTKVTQSENKYEYSLFVGSRYWKSQMEGGFTVDGYIGFGVGYRNKQPDYSTPNPEYDALFEDLPDSNFSYAIRLGLNLGFAIRSRRR